MNDKNKDKKRRVIPTALKSKTFTTTTLIILGLIIAATILPTITIAWASTQTNSNTCNDTPICSTTWPTGSYVGQCSNWASFTNTGTAWVEGTVSLTARGSVFIHLDPGETYNWYEACAGSCASSDSYAGQTCTVAVISDWNYGSGTLAYTMSVYAKTFFSDPPTTTTTATTTATTTVPPPPGNVNVDVHCSVSGANLAGLTVYIFQDDDVLALSSDTTDATGHVVFVVEENHYYTVKATYDGTERVSAKTYCSADWSTSLSWTAPTTTATTTTTTTTTVAPISCSGTIQIKDSAGNWHNYIETITLGGDNTVSCSAGTFDSTMTSASFTIDGGVIYGIKFSVSLTGFETVTITLADLDNTRDYQIYVDDAYWKTITGVSSHTWDFTGWSAHTIEYVATTDTPPPNGGTTNGGTGTVVVTTSAPFDYLTEENGDTYVDPAHLQSQIVIYSVFILIFAVIGCAIGSISRTGPPLLWGNFALSSAIICGVYVGMLYMQIDIAFAGLFVETDSAIIGATIRGVNLLLYGLVLALGLRYFMGHYKK